MSEEVKTEMNFGRRIPVTEEVKVEEPKIVEQETKEDVKKEPAWNKAVISKELFTEINLFIPQILGLILSVLIGLATVLVTRVMSIGLVENLKDQVSEEIYLSLSNNFNAWNNFVLIGVAVPILIYAGFLLVKFLFLMPRKDRNIVVRIFNARAILFSIENVKAKMLFNPKDKKTEVMIDNPSKHYDYMNGRPIVFLGQEDRTNVSVIREDVDPSGKGRDIDSMVGNALHTGYEIAREQLAQREDKTKIMLILLIVILAAIALVGFVVMRTPDTVIQGVVAAIGATSTIPATV